MRAPFQILAIPYRVTPELQFCVFHRADIDLSLIHIYTTEDKLLETIIRQMAEAQGIDEDLKARDQMAWVGAMNNIKSAALEILRESK